MEQQDEVGRPGWQFGILTALLLTAVCATWFGWYRSKTEANYYAIEIPPLKIAARELDIKDPTKFAAVKQESDWIDQDIWLVYLPEGHQFKLMAEFTVFEGSEFNHKPFEVAIKPGKHRIALFDQVVDGKSKLTVELDGVEVISAGGDKMGQFSTGGSSSQDAVQVSVNDLLELKAEKWTSVDDPAQAKAVFDARNKTKQYYKTRLHIQTVENQ